MATLQELLAPQVIFKEVVDRIKPVGDVLQRFLGLQIGSGNTEDVPGRSGAYDIFDSVRDLASIRNPGAGPYLNAPQVVGQVPVTCARVHEAIPLKWERIFPLRKMGGPSVQVDKGGEDYIRRQKEVLRRRVANTREFLASALMRGTCQILVSGDSYVPVYTGGNITIDWQIPAGNKTTLNMTGGGAIIPATEYWSDTTNAPIFEQVMKINAAFVELHGYPLKHIWINSTVWSYVTNNAGLKARSGSSNQVFNSFTGLGRDGKGEYVDDEMRGEIRCLPGIMWHVYDAGLVVNGTYTKFFPDTSAAFWPEPHPEMLSTIRGSEFVQENEVSPAQLRQGAYYYPTYHREPAEIRLTALENLMFALKIPKVAAYGTVA